ncbi:SDR family NAD(P)-dependent oxidoreductase [Cereibacter sphaeroides]|uniref:SDR family NAD(P)-dependent oxidoreductase n=1 Tax=Cereibacter sphaeroides TaxID=1063 RepID=UPI001F3F2EE2|nr:SDR family NAD(P)-dependent oxidoreductase [Cereibacter sphaeroides]MCE6950590.1 SDR family NAD(P)-dependent oxidoreductase [Cereibacter sphaeroides]
MTLAVITGASTGIGHELARCAAEDGCELILCADEPAIETVAEEMGRLGVPATACKADLSTEEGVETLWRLIGDREVDYLMANAGRGLGHAFLDQQETDIEAVIGLNVTGTTLLLHRAAKAMQARGQGRILITGSIAGLMPGSHHAVYNATKAYLDTLSWGIREELSDSGVTVTCLMPGPTDTDFFRRADMLDTPVGQGKKDDAGMVAREGYRAMKRAASGVTTGFMNKVQATLSGLVPDSVLAAMHRRMAEPQEKRHD